MNVKELLTINIEYEFWPNARSIYFKDGYSLQIFSYSSDISYNGLAVTFDNKIINSKICI